jgi:glutamate/tyrosine decarboxylase-like PLP-dependent enzyme
VRSVYGTLGVLRELGASVMLKATLRWTMGECELLGQVVGYACQGGSEAVMVCARVTFNSFGMLGGVVVSEGDASLAR